MYFTITGVKKIIRYTEDFVLYRFVISLGGVLPRILDRGVPRRLVNPNPI